MSDDDILDEMESINQAIKSLDSAPRSISRRDKVLWGLGLGLGTTGVLVGGPVSLAALLVVGGGFGVLGADMVLKLGDLRGDAEIAALLTHLETRRARLWRELKRRHPSGPAP